VERAERRERGEVLQRVVREIGAGKDDGLQRRERSEVSESVVGDAGRFNDHCDCGFEHGELFHIRVAEPVPGEVDLHDGRLVLLPNDRTVVPFDERCGGVLRVFGRLLRFGGRRIGCVRLPTTRPDHERRQEQKHKEAEPHEATSKRNGALSVPHSAPRDNAKYARDRRTDRRSGALRSSHAERQRLTF
jgi:hypothetical protein